MEKFEWRKAAFERGEQPWAPRQPAGGFRLKQEGSRQGIGITSGAFSSNTAQATHFRECLRGLKPGKREPRRVHVAFDFSPCAFGRPRTEEEIVAEMKRCKEAKKPISRSQANRDKFYPLRGLILVESRKAADFLVDSLRIRPQFHRGPGKVMVGSLFGEMQHECRLMIRKGGIWLHWMFLARRPQPMTEEDASEVIIGAGDPGISEFLTTIDGQSTVTEFGGGLALRLRRYSCKLDFLKVKEELALARVDAARGSGAERLTLAQLRTKLAADGDFGQSVMARYWRAKLRVLELPRVRLLPRCHLLHLTTHLARTGAHPLHPRLPLRRCASSRASAASSSCRGCRRAT